MKTRLFGMRKHGTYILMAALILGSSACATTKRAAQLAIDHHLGMVQGAWDIVTGEAEAREQRVALLRTDLETNRVRIEAEQDQSRSLELLKQHVLLQDALVAELMHGGHQGHGQQHASVEADAPLPHDHAAAAE